MRLGVHPRVAHAPSFGGSTVCCVNCDPDVGGSPRSYISGGQKEVLIRYTYRLYKAMASVKHKELYIPDFEEVTEVLRGGLESNFANVSVDVVDCPDLTQPPFTLAAQGICGSPRLADVGGVPYLMPLANKDKIYNFEKVSVQVDVPDAFIIGAGAGPHHIVGVNNELIPNIRVGGENKTYTCKINPDDNSYILEKAKSKDFCLLANLYVSEGKPGKVIEVKASKRTGEENFVTCMRKTLKAKYGEKPVGFGGVFLIEKGKAKIHVMPEFSTKPIESDAAVNEWLKFYEMKATLVCLSTFISADPGLDLRVEHTHCFSHHGDGGHYHYDVTPEEVEYRGFFVPAEYIYRIDAPEKTHMIGRD
ncbi:ester hydrolase C11orf54 homolog [Ptychodera flava]|uniref:ester hydrolase C11orf54 homolog n=1 Tax=Ptychodera flava TaxID=63121 RepID=UPI00396A25E0